MKKIGYLLAGLVIAISASVYSTWDGSGNFSRVHDWTDDRDAGTKILASRMDEEDDNFAAGIGAALTKNNESKPTADFRPNADAAYDLGSASLRWVDVMLSGAVKFVDATGDVGSLVITTLSTDRTYTLPDADGTLMTSVFDDTSPSLSGDLDVEDETILTTTTNGNIVFLPDGTGAVSVTGTTDYEGNVTDDDDLPNKKYVDGHAQPLHAIGTVSSGTQTPEPATGFFKTLTNGGAFTLAPPTTVGYYLLVITNNASAGAITTSGFGDVFGDAFTTTNGHIFMCLVIDDGTNSVLKVKALQ